MAEIDWLELGRLPHRVVDGADLDLLELVQSGVLEPWLEPARGTAPPNDGRTVLTPLVTPHHLSPITHFPLPIERNSHEQRPEG